MNKKDEFEITKTFYDHLMSEKDHYRLKEQWHGWAGNFHRYRIKLLRNIFLNELKITKYSRILDIGCGGSIFSEMFTPGECPQVTGFDISTVIIKKVKEKHSHINFSVDNAQDPNIKGEWDILYAGEIIEHLHQPKEALEKWYTLLKKGGYIVITTPNGIFSRTNEEHISLFTINEMKKCLRGKFEIINIYGVDLPIPFANMIMNYFLMQKFPHVSDKIYQFKMRLPFKLPCMAYDIIYIAKKI
ncbi:MAG: class I SAM-dependent methyltransferase [Euryarchaeota archaeon]|nr:class I SAM-dependent methyltransferase [Euryarchaeota archaeon]